MDSARVQGNPSGFKPRPKSDADIRPIPLGPLVVEAIRRQLPPGNDPQDLFFTGPGGGPGHGGMGCQEARARCCRATTSTAPTTPPWPS